MYYQNDPNGQRLPVKIDTTSNGEFAPVPLSERNIKANEQAQQSASYAAKRLALGRREFMVSACGVASTLLAFNSVNQAYGVTGGYFDVDQEAAFDLAAAEHSLAKKEFIFDVQGHYVNPNGDWLKGLPKDAKPLSSFPNTCLAGADKSDLSYLNCLGEDAFIKDIFMDSDTDLMVLSFVPSTPERSPLTIEEADATRKLVDKLEGHHRLLLHGRVNPNQPGDLQAMDELAQRWQVSAFKTYTQWGPDGQGYWLDDPKYGIAFIEKARQLGVHVICVHKGLSFGGQNAAFARCDDIGRVAKLFPDMMFLVYHSGFELNVPEAAYDANNAQGINTLVKSLIDNDIKPNQNVYAELGSTWRFLMRNPEQAAHALGKLIRYVGDKNVLWGTDSIWYGSPQDQIQAFRTFQISKAFQEQYGYQALSTELKAGIFGLNALTPYKLSLGDIESSMNKDAVSKNKQNYLNQPDPHFTTYGPKTRREFLNVLKWEQG